ncbi:substrate-binding periplasmic protein [Thalassotalea eurytherma]|uniref:Solute-binding protein family 3/N-terminal domain-containing protein n=1 Tax=Thalassotalea eurytherma TaxID=1144278 RepID=A0ABQ6H9B3_9GAMM|nr:transporter substrate-binding domain-containing protein [Thalassotalea eurytherma]GLX83031.1 hypothetical protein theurythT_24830 [Thalassotalea eurytherma]
MLYKIVGFLLLFYSPYSDALFNKLEISMVATHLEHFIEYDHHGAIDLLMADIAHASGIVHQYSVLSFARARRSFLRKKISCVLPASNLPMIADNQNTIQSMPIATKQFHVYTLKDNVPVTNRVSLDNKVIGVVKNALPNYKELLRDNQTKIIEVSNFKALVELLTIGRVDAMIQDSASVNMLLSNEQKRALFFDPTLDFIVDEIKITCHKNRATELYINSINHAILNMESKTIQHYLNKMSSKASINTSNADSPNAA